MWWHADAYQLMGLAPSIDSGIAAWIEALERRSGLRVPAAVREWYSVPAATAWLAQRHCNPLVAGHDLGVPLGGIDYLNRGQLATETDSQHCCRWLIRLQPSIVDADPLLTVSTDMTAAGDDPPVFLVDPEDEDPFEERYADRFSTYVLTSVWDAQLPADERTVCHFDHPLPPQALGILRQRYTELPATYAWAGNQGCDAVYRFDGTAQVMIAIKGEEVLYSVVVAETDHRRAELLTLLGL